MCYGLETESMSLKPRNESCACEVIEGGGVSCFVYADVMADDVMGVAADFIPRDSGAKEPTAGHGMDEEAESEPRLMSIPSFQRFYSIWVEQEDALLFELKRALGNPRNEQEFARLVRKCYQHYSEAVHAKIGASHDDASYITTGAWKTPLEAGMMWMGGWRPTSAIILTYSLMGIHMESELNQLLEGINLPSMAALSSRQLARQATFFISCANAW